MLLRRLTLHNFTASGMGNAWSSNAYQCVTSERLIFMRAMVLKRFLPCSCWMACPRVVGTCLGFNVFRRSARVQFGGVRVFFWLLYFTGVGWARASVIGWCDASMLSF